MGTAAQDQGQPARLRTDLTPKFGSWKIVAIVFGLSAAALLQAGIFFRQLSELPTLVEASENLSSASREMGKPGANPGFDLYVQGTLLGLITVVSIAGGGTLFLFQARRLERLLLKRAAEIEEIDKSRRLFFAQASHELRTPVTIMRGEAEVALSDDANDVTALQEALQHVIASSTFLGHRLEEMIGLARTADGQLHLETEQVDLREIVAEAAHDARWFARSVEVRVDVRLPDKPVLVTGDALWLKRATLALIENAIKFSPIEGRVTAKLTARDALAKIEVTDEGSGVVWEELPLIFEAYYQTTNGRNRGGSGLGLAMTRWVAEQHGGKATAENLGHPRHPCGCLVSFTVRRELEA